MAMLSSSTAETVRPSVCSRVRSATSADGNVAEPAINATNCSPAGGGGGEVVTVMVVVADAVKAPSNALSLTTYAPGSEKDAEVDVDEGEPKVTDPGPETFDQVVWSVPVGRPSSETVPLSDAGPGDCTDVAGPALTTGGELVVPLDPHWLDQAVGHPVHDEGGSSVAPAATTTAN